jgi:hypothetical protein
MTWSSSEITRDSRSTSGQTITNVSYEREKPVIAAGIGYFAQIKWTLVVTFGRTPWIIDSVWHYPPTHDQGQSSTLEMIVPGTEEKNWSRMTRNVPSR